MKAIHRRGSGGFVLVLTLWILVAIAIAAAYFGERVHTALRLASARQDLSQAQIALHNGQAETLYRLATSPMSRYGLGDPPDVVRLDGRAYTESGGLLRLQDQGGLLDLNTFVDAHMLALLGTLGVRGDSRLSLVDALRDYNDADSLRRLNGAESEQYRSTGQPDLPRNQALVTPQELRSVLGWSQQPSLWKDPGILEFTTTGGGARINPNTASWQVLSAMSGITPEAARAIIERRELEPVSAGWIDRMFGTQHDGLPSTLLSLPANSVRVTQSVPGLPWSLRYNVKLTPKEGSAPWEISYFYRLESIQLTRGQDPKSAAQTATNSNLPASYAPDPQRLPPRAAQPSAAPRLLGP